MPVSSQEFFEEAEKLNDTAATEFHFRNAASRYYYALFHKALELAKSEALIEGEAPPDSTAESTHKALRSFYEYCKTDDVDKRRNFRFLKLKLQLSHRERCAADYDLEEDFSVDRLNLHVKNCASAIERIQQIKTASSLAEQSGDTEGSGQGS